MRRRSTDGRFGKTMKNILLTCFGSSLFYEIFLDFQKRKEIGLFVSDVNPRARARMLAGNILPTLPADHPDFCADLLEKAQDNKIAMIIPGGDEEALALMRSLSLFEEAGILVAVQDTELFPLFQTKTNLYDYLKAKGFPLPRYQRFQTKEEFAECLQIFDYPSKPLLIKPNSARGGNGVTILSERLIANQDHLSLMDRGLCEQAVDGRTEFVMMEYLEGTIYDIDVLCYQNGKNYFGVRRRLNNVSKLFSGNVFENNEAILHFARKLYAIFPTKYLVDYDVMADREGRLHLLEINPRPSGSTISYLPFGTNLYYLLAKSYLDGEHIEIEPSFLGKTAFSFHKMIGGKL